VYLVTALAVGGGCASLAPRVEVQVDLSRAHIVVPAAPDAGEHAAAALLADALSAVAGSPVPVVTPETDAAGSYAFVIGRAASPPKRLLPPHPCEIGASETVFQPAPETAEGLALRRTVACFLRDHTDIRRPTLNPALSLGGGPPLALRTARGRPSAPAPLLPARLFEGRAVDDELQAQLDAWLPAGVADGGRRPEAIAGWLAFHGLEDAGDGEASPRLPPPTLGLPYANHEGLRAWAAAGFPAGSAPRVSGCPGGAGLDAFAAYVLVRAAADPAADLDTIDWEFCRAFGPAAAAVQRYLDYWREHYRRAIVPFEREAEADDAEAFAGRFLRRAGTLYSAEDFTAAAERLHEALSRDLGTRPRRLLQQLLVAHEHAALTFQAVRAMREAAASDSDVLVFAARNALQLSEFRRSFADHLAVGVPGLAALELRHGDATGWDLVRQMAAWRTGGGLRDFVARRLDGTWRIRPAPVTADLAAPEIHRLKPGGLAKWPRVRLADGGVELSPASATGAASGPAGGPSAGGEGAAAVPALPSGPVWFGLEFDALPEVFEGKEVFLDIYALTVPCHVYLNGDWLADADAGPPRPQRPRAFRLAVNPSRLAPEDPQLLVLVTDAGLTPGDAPWGALWLTTPAAAP